MENLYDIAYQIYYNSVILKNVCLYLHDSVPTKDKSGVGMAADKT